MNRSEKAANEFEGKTHAVQEMITGLISAAEEVVKENDGRNKRHEGGHDKNSSSPARSRTHALVQELGVMKSKVLVIEREEVKPVLKAKIKALSKVRNTSHTMLMDTEGGEWKHCIKHMRRLDRATDEITERFDRLQAGLNDAHSQVQAACRAIGGSLAELMTLPPRERPYIVRLNPPEDGLLAVIEGTQQGRGGRPIISTIHASSTGELDLSSFSPGTYMVRISTEATPPILLHEVFKQAIQCTSLPSPPLIPVCLSCIEGGKDTSTTRCTSSPDLRPANPYMYSIAAGLMSCSIHPPLHRAVALIFLPQFQSSLLYARLFLIKGRHPTANASC